MNAASFSQDFLSILEMCLMLYGIFTCLIIDIYCAYRGLKYALLRDKHGFLFFYATIIYAIWYAMDKSSPHNGAVRYVWMKQQLPDWTLPVLSYFPLNVHFMTELSDHKRYIFGYHPHGILPLGAMSLTVQKQKFFGQMGTISLHFKIPLWRELAMLCGFVDVSKHACEAALSRNGSILLAVGGAKEATDAFVPNHMILTIRDGFFRLAMKAGTPVVPVIAFGELGLFRPVKMERGKWLRRLESVTYRHLGLLLPLFKGGHLALLPTRQPISVHVGMPIDVVHTSHPTMGQLAALRKEYTEQLRDMFNLFNPDPKLVLTIKS